MRGGGDSLKTSLRWCEKVACIIQNARFVFIAELLIFIVRFESCFQISFSGSGPGHGLAIHLCHGTLDDRPVTPATRCSCPCFPWPRAEVLPPVQLSIEQRKTLGIRNTQSEACISNIAIEPYGAIYACLPYTHISAHTQTHPHKHTQTF